MILGLIPSRIGSSRLKKKPLLKIDGYPIIVHTFKRAMLSKKLDQVIVCTDHKEIVDVVEKNNGKAILTSKKHKNGSERIYEVAKKLKPKLVVDIQGDEPLVNPNDIDRVIEFHKKNMHFDIVVPSMIIKKDINSDSRNLIKVVFSKRGKIIYFSRAKVPFDYNNKNIKYFKDLSIVSFKPNALKKYCEVKIGEIEKKEGIELIRALENDISMGTFVIKGSSFSVDAKQDLMRAINVMPRDPIRKRY